MWLNQQKLTRPQSLTQPVPSCAQGAMGRTKTRECLSLLTFHQPLLPLRALCEDYWGRVSQKPETGFEKV